jgi:hypothetical protein
MDTIHIDVAGDRQVGLRFEQFPEALYEDFRQEIDALSIELFALIRADTPELTGKMLSQERRRLFTDENRITGYIDIAGDKGGSDFAKAGALEYGSSGKSFERQAHSMKLDHLWSAKLAEPMTVMVKAITLPGNIAEHRFERGPLEAMRPQVLARLNAIVEKRVAEANA